MKTLLPPLAFVLMLGGAVTLTVLGLAGQVRAQGLCDRGLCDLAPMAVPPMQRNDETAAELYQQGLEAAGRAQAKDLQNRMDLNALGFGVHR
jgi:predicted N-acetyltransferase YhbS